MSERKLVSVVTATWNRHDMLLEAIENVRQQTYRPLEHVIVADGPDEELENIVWDTVGGSDVRLTFVELGFHSSTVLTNSISAAPFMVAQLLARGEYQMWMADDERCLVPDHIERLVGLLEQYDADFAYPRVQMTWPDSEQVMVIGGNPPRRGQFTLPVPPRPLGQGHAVSDACRERQRCRCPGAGDVRPRRPLGVPAGSHLHTSG